MNLASLRPIERHYALLRLRQGRDTDADALKSAHQFIWPEEEKSDRGRRQWGGSENSEADLPWEVRLARRYYKKLHREYALADMTRYKEGAVGLRWRTEQEVFDGKGQFTCGNKACAATDGLESFELNFVYTEHGERKQALVKLRACPQCADKLNYKRRKQEKREKRRAEKEERRRARREEKRARRRSRERSRSRERDGDASDDSAAEEDGQAAAALPIKMASSGATAAGEADADDENFARYCGELLR